MRFQEEEEEEMEAKSGSKNRRTPPHGSRLQEKGKSKHLKSNFFMHTTWRISFTVNSVDPDGCPRELCRLVAWDGAGVVAGVRSGGLANPQTTQNVFSFDLGSNTGREQERKRLRTFSVSCE